MAPIRSWWGVKQWLTMIWKLTFRIQIGNVKSLTSTISTPWSCTKGILRCKATTMHSSRIKILDSGTDMMMTMWSWLDQTYHLSRGKLNNHTYCSIRRSIHHKRASSKGIRTYRTTIFQEKIRVEAQLSIMN